MAYLVSVGIPTHNGAKHLRQSIESVLAQTFERFELVIVDDMSSDQTWDIAQEYARQDARVSAVRNTKRLGLVANFNRCIELTQGRYLCVWHQDDVMTPENLEKKIAVLETNPRVGLVHSNVSLIDDQGRILGEHWEVDSTRDYVLRGQDFFSRMMEPERNYVCCPSVLARRECYEKLGHFRSELYFTCDWEMWARISLYYDVACLGEPLVHFRRHRHSESYRIEGTIAEIEQELLAKHLLLAAHGHRIPDATRIEKRVVDEIACEELLRARRVFFEGRIKEAWKRLYFGIKLRPASLWRPEFTGTLVRLMLGRTACRWLKSARSKQI